MWLLLVTPDAEPLVATWRAEHDPSARFGVPAHVTVRSPFLPPERWTDPALTRLAEFLPLTLTLARVEDRRGALVVVAEPDDRLRELTEATTRTWPLLPPHKPDHRPFAYHVTVVRSPDRRIRSNATDAIAPHLPLRVTGTELWAAAESPEHGFRHAVVARMQHPERD